MEQILNILLLVCFYNMALGQKTDPNAIFFKSKGSWNCPVVKGKILPYEKFSEVPPETGVSFISDSASIVHAVFDGKVLLINKYDDVLMIVVNYGSYSIAYANLSKSLVQKGDDIKAGQSIGNMGLDLDGRYILKMQLASTGVDYLDILPWFKKPIQ